MCLLFLALTRSTSAALSLALPASDYPPRTVISAYPATNAQVDLLLSAAHRSSFRQLHRKDGLGWIQAALWWFHTGKGAAGQRHRTTFGYAISIFHDYRQARKAVHDTRIHLTPHRVAHLKGYLFESTDAVQSLRYLLFNYKNVEIEAYVEYRGSAPSRVTRLLRRILNRQTTHLAHIARTYAQLMREMPPQQATPSIVPMMDPTAIPQPTSHLTPPTATPTSAPPTSTPLPTSAPPTMTPLSTPSAIPSATTAAVPAIVAVASTTSATYAPNTEATVQIQVTGNGRAISGARVAANFAFPGQSLSCAALTNQLGTASCSVLVPELPDGTQVPVSIQVVGPRGEQALARTSFTVQHAGF
ncbi:MAG: hypothetical protein PVSMB7_09340 [Chloroflexota bacterium]